MNGRMSLSHKPNAEVLPPRNAMALDTLAGVRGEMARLIELRLNGTAPHRGSLWGDQCARERVAPQIFLREKSALKSAAWGQRVGAGALNAHFGPLKASYFNLLGLMLVLGGSHYFVRGCPGGGKNRWHKHAYLRRVVLLTSALGTSPRVFLPHSGKIRFGTQ